MVLPYALFDKLISFIGSSLLLIWVVMNSSFDLRGQVISFNDLSLKSYLTSEICVDTNIDGTYDINADINSNGEIELNEALDIIDLRVRDYYPNIYSIKSIQDLSKFKSLKRLSVISNYSIENISDLGLDSLEFLWIGTGQEYKRIDISDLPSIFDLRIEDIDSLDYLNLKNGSFAGGIFSLFYTQNIVDACVDSIAEEYNEVAWRMIDNAPQLECELSTGITNLENGLSIYPNPCSDYLYVQSTDLENDLGIYDIGGEIVFRQKFFGHSHRFDLRSLHSGIYLVQLESDKQMFTQLLIIKH